MKLLTFLHTCIAFLDPSDLQQHLKFVDVLPVDFKEKYNETPLKVKSFEDTRYPYNCYTPSESKDDKLVDQISKEYESPYRFLSYLLKSDSECYLILEGYWNYEICLSKYVRQFHEERKGQGKTDVNSFFLGKKPTYQINGPYTDFNKLFYKNKEYPYYLIEFSAGDICDVSGEERTTSVKLICEPELASMNRFESVAVIQLKETSSCNYEVIIAVGALCFHEMFRPDVQDHSDIICIADNLNQGPRIPEIAVNFNRGAGRKIIDHEIPQTKLPGYTPPPVDEIPSTSGNIKMMNTPKPELASSNYMRQFKNMEHMMESFFSGDTCFTAGTGWWRYEYCFGNHVKQFHDDGKTERIEILLGKWDRDTHTAWAEDALKDKNKARPPAKIKDYPDLPVTKSPHRIATHKYINGDICDLTGKPRFVFVKHLCNENLKQINMVLYEPTVCGYVLTFESSISCEVLDYADKHGIPDDLHEISDESETEKQDKSDIDIETDNAELEANVPFTRELRSDPIDEKRHREKQYEGNKKTMDDEDYEDEDIVFENEEEDEETRTLKKQLLDDVIRMNVLVTFIEEATVYTSDNKPIKISNSDLKSILTEGIDLNEFDSMYDEYSVAELQEELGILRSDHNELIDKFDLLSNKVYNEVEAAILSDKVTSTNSDTIEKLVNYFEQLGYDLSDDQEDSHEVDSQSTKGNTVKSGEKDQDLEEKLSQIVDKVHSIEQAVKKTKILREVIKSESADDNEE